MSRAARWASYTVATVVVVVAVLAIGLVSFDWNRALPWLNQRLSQSLGRTVTIVGPLSLSWRIPALHHHAANSAHDTPDAGKPASGAGEPGDAAESSSYIPVLHVSVQNLRIGNPAWAHKPDFATLDALDFDLRLLPLLAHTVVVPALSLKNPALDLERQADGTQNWLFKLQGESGGSGWRLSLGRIEFPSGQIAVNDAPSSARLQIAVNTLGQAIAFEDTLAKFHRADAAAAASAAAASGAAAAAAASMTAPASGATVPPSQAGASGLAGAPAAVPARAIPPYAIGLTVAGTYKAVSLKGTAKLGSVLTLNDATQPFPIQADIHYGESRIRVAGTLTDPVHLAAVDMRLWLSGASLANLVPLVGATLPSTAPYSVDGRLSGQFSSGSTRLRYDDFTGRVGGSDLGGSLQFQQQAPRPLLTGTLRSRLLQFADLAPLLGADSNASKAQRGDSFRQPDDRALPAEPFNTDRWKVLDVDINFSGDRIVRTDNLPIDNLTAHVTMDAGVLKLDPLKFGVAGGTLDTHWQLNGGTTPLQTSLKLEARHLKLKQLFPGVKTMQTSLGEMNGDAALTATGNSIAALAAGANGELKLIVTDGTISSTLLEEAGLNVGNIVVEKLFGNKDVKINCAASDFVATDGILNTRFFALDTQDALISTTGDINLKTEQMNLTVRPQTKGFRVFSLRSPLYVKGTFKKPDVGVDKLALALRGSAVVGLAILAPPAAFLPLLSPSHNVDLPCAKILGQLDRPSTAPAPGQRERALPALDASSNDAAHAATQALPKAPR